MHKFHHASRCTSFCACEEASSLTLCIGFDWRVVVLGFGGYFDLASLGLLDLQICFFVFFVLFFFLVFDLGSWRSFWIFDLDCWLFYWVVGGNILNGWWCFGGWLLFPTWSFGWWVMVVCAIVLAFGGLRTMQNFPFYCETNIEKWFPLYFQVGNQTWYNENILLKIF